MSPSGEAAPVQTVGPAGAWVFRFGAPKVPVALLERVWRLASHFALVRRGTRVVDALPTRAPAAELRRVVEAAAALRECLEEARWVTAWPGGGGEGANLWVLGRAVSPPPFPLEAGTLWRGVGSFSDLQLYRRGALLLHASSEQGRGAVWGEEAFFRGLGLPAEPANPEERWALVGPPAGPALLDRLRAG